MGIEVPEPFIQLGPELLIHSDWERMPPRDESWVDQRLSWVRRQLEDRPWKTWTSVEWINALVFVGVGLAVFGNLMTVIAEARRASAIR